MKPRRLALMTLCAALLAGCIHEYPGDNPVDPTLIDLRVSLAVNIDFETEAGAGQFAQACALLFADGYRIRYTLDLYETPASAEAPLTQRICRLTATDNTLPPGGTYRFGETAPLHALHYTALVWIDFVPEGNTGDYYYHTGNLQAVTIAGNRPYRGYHLSKDAFAATAPIDLTPYRNTWNIHHEITIQARRPFALYQIVATDAAKYRAAHSGVPYETIRPATTALLYDLWFPMSYNTYRAVPDSFDASGIHYSYDIADPEAQDTETVIAADFVFVNGDDTFYFVDIDIYTPAGAPIDTRPRHIRINLRRNRRTVIRGDFLTPAGNPGGAGIDFSFGEETILFI